MNVYNVSEVKLENYRNEILSGTFKLLIAAFVYRSLNGSLNRWIIKLPANSYPAIPFPSFNYNLRGRKFFSPLFSELNASKVNNLEIFSRKY